MTFRTIRTPTMAVGIALLGLATAGTRATTYPSPPPADLFTVALDDFSRDWARIASIDDRTVRGAGGKGALDVPLDRLLLLERSAASPVDVNGWFVLTRRDGQRLVGKPGEIRDDAIAWTGRSIGGSTVPLAAIASIEAAGGKQSNGPANGGAQDELRLTNGDVLQGIVSGSTADAVTVQSAEGQAVPVEWRNVRRLRFAPAGEPPNAAPARARVTLADGSRLLASDLRLTDGRVTFRADGRPCDVAIADVTRIENLAGNVRLLADVAPATSASAPYFPSIAGRAAGDSTDRARALVAAGDAASAMLARPRSVVTWAVAETGAKRFHARYLIPAGLPQADVTIRVRADDRVLFERANVRSGESSPPPIDVELGGAKTLTLEVDFGERYDVQDEFYWLDAALIAAPK